MITITIEPPLQGRVVNPRTLTRGDDIRVDGDILIVDRAVEECIYVLVEGFNVTKKRPDSKDIFMDADVRKITGLHRLLLLHLWNESGLCNRLRRKFQSDESQYARPYRLHKPQGTRSQRSRRRELPHMHVRKSSDTYRSMSPISCHCCTGSPSCDDNLPAPQAPVQGHPMETSSERHCHSHHVPEINNSCLESTTPQGVSNEQQY